MPKSSKNDVDATLSKTFDLAVSVLKQIPSRMAKNAEELFLQKDNLELKEYSAAYRTGFELLGEIVTTAVRGGQALPKDAADRALVLAFGDNAASRSLRDFLGKPFGPDTIPPHFDLPDISRYIAAGNLRDHFRTMMSCGQRLNQLLLASRQPVGRITSITPNPVCSPATITVGYDGLGSSAPPTDIDFYLITPVTDKDGGFSNQF